MEPVTPESLARFVTRLGESCPHPAVLYLVGGSALPLLGSPRETLDVDYMADAPPEAAQELRQAMTHLAAAVLASRPAAERAQRALHLLLAEAQLTGFRQRQASRSVSQCGIIVSESCHGIGVPDVT